MTQILSPTRRWFLAGSTGLAAGCATGSGAGAQAPPPDLAIRGLELPSESVHSGVASSDGTQRLTLRICRYPTQKTAWLWLHAKTPGGVYSFVDHLAPCGADATPQSDVGARYADLANRIVFERQGRVDLPTSAHVSAHVPAHRTANSRFGPGPHEVSAQIRFRPGRAYTGLNAGRTEVFGTAEAEIRVGREVYAFEGPAQYHEQRQSAPRFMTPFAYVTLWSADAGATFLTTPRRADGYLLEGAASSDATVLRLDPPGEHIRRLAIRLSDGRVLEGETRLTQAYTLPLYGETWRGHFLSASLGGHIFQGNVNDYLSDQLTYPG